MVFLYKKFYQLQYIRKMLQYLNKQQKDIQQVREEQANYKIIVQNYSQQKIDKQTQDPTNKNQQKKNVIVNIVDGIYTYRKKISILLIISITFFISLFYIINITRQEAFPFQIYNRQFQQQIFGNFSEFYIKWSQQNMSQFSTLSNATFFYKQIQVGSVLDFGLTQSIDFDKLQKQLFKKVRYQLAYFQFKQSLQRQKSLVQKYFADSQQIENFLDQLSLNSKAKQKSIQYNLAIQLLKDQNNPKILQAEYYFANKKYDLQNQEQQLPFCIYSGGSNLGSKQDRYIKYFQQIQKLNYTNFHIVYVDDFSEDGSFQEIYKYLKQSQLRIRNRIKMIHNLQKLGPLANMNFWIKKYCKNDDIVVIIDADDKIIGRQGFKIINSLYRSPNIWYAYSKFILTRANQKQFQKGVVSTFLKYKIQDYRSSFDWQTSAMRTFRKKLLDSVPLSSLIQYHYQKDLGIIWPRFYRNGADMFIVHSQLQIAGYQRISHIQEYLYLYYFQDHNISDCFRDHQKFDGYKSKIKTPLKLLPRLGLKSQSIKYYTINQLNLRKVQRAYNDTIKCQQKLLKTLQN